MASIPQTHGRSFALRHRALRFGGGVFLALAWLALSAARAQTTNNALGTTNLLVGPAAGLNSVVLRVTPANGAWTAAANASWLHLSQAFQGGAGSTNVIFTCDANPGPTRSGALTIAGQTLTVTQAGSTYVAAGKLTTLAPSDLNTPNSVAVDGAGNVYISDQVNNAIKKWTVASNSVTTLVSSNVSQPLSVAVDRAGNVFFTSGQSIQEWTAANGNVITLVSSGLALAAGLAVDGAGNVYVADLDNRAIDEWTVANGYLTQLVSSGLSGPAGVAVDGAGNVYIADWDNNSIDEWTVADGHLTLLLSTGLSSALDVTVDGAGNVYFTSGNAIQEWTAANGAVTTLVSSGLSHPFGVAVDGAANVYISDTANSAIYELPHAFVDPTPKLEGPAAGNDALPAVLPAAENLLPPFAPTSDQSWLTITGVTNGVVSFSFTANAGPARAAHVSLLGQSIAVTQGLMSSPPILTGARILANGACQFYFSNYAGSSFSVLSATNLSLPLSNWILAGTATNRAPGQFQFTTQPLTHDGQRYYRVRSP